MPLQAITAILAANQITGLLALICGPLSDRWGYRRILLVGLGLLAIGLLLGGIFPLYGLVFSGLMLASLGKSLFDPAIQAYAGAQIPYQRRGQVMGLIELGWAGSSLIGIPLVGLLIGAWGWRSPFFALSVLALISLAGVFLFIPEAQRAAVTPISGRSFWKIWQSLIQERAALGMLGCAFGIGAANDTLFVVYGAWLEQAFGLNLVALGLSTSVLGVAELLGEGLTAGLADWMGLKKAVSLGLLLSSLSYFLLPALGTTLPFALTLLFCVFLTVEFTIVTSLSFASEILPNARATMMSGYLAAIGLGRVVGALLGGRVWTACGMIGVGLSAASLSAIALAAFLIGTRHRKNKPAPSV